MTLRRAYDPGLQTFAAWSLESPIFTCMLAIQCDGNETRIIGSHDWKNAALSKCINESARLFPWHHFATHIVPHDPDHVWQSVFERRDCYVEQAPNYSDTLTLARELLHTLKIDTAERSWTNKNPNNQQFVDAIGQHAPEPEPKWEGFKVTLRHNLPTFYMRALEVFAAWRHQNPPRRRRPDYRLHDRAVI